MVTSKQRTARPLNAACIRPPGLTGDRRHRPVDGATNTHADRNTARESCEDHGAELANDVPNSHQCHQLWSSDHQKPWRRGLRFMP